MRLSTYRFRRDALRRASLVLAVCVLAVLASCDGENPLKPVGDPGRAILKIGKKTYEGLAVTGVDPVKGQYIRIYQPESLESIEILIGDAPTPAVEGAADSPVPTYPPSFVRDLTYKGYVSAEGFASYSMVSGGVAISDAYPSGYYGRLDVGTGLPGYELVSLKISGTFWAVPADTIAAARR